MGSGRNSITTKRGVVLGAHYHSVALGRGANDNGSGTAVLLELARGLAQTDGSGGKPHKHTLVFVWFDATELGLARGITLPV